MITKVKHGTRRKTPAPPFITSTLQQEASRKLGFQSRRTMKVAQELYEGVDIEGMGATGLITYMRTDSLRISDVAKEEAAQYILNRFGEKFLPAKPRVFKNQEQCTGRSRGYKTFNAEPFSGRCKGKPYIRPV